MSIERADDGRWMAFTGRNNRPGTFHWCPDWVSAGKRSCDGVNMTNAGWTTDEHMPAAHLKTCKHCARKAEVR